ncbi:MAG TPA: amidohydrolase family protein [Afifellaceae bacterium]|nr:amidohydrolase family protein [Afifellaceae bacterium]
MLKIDIYNHFFPTSYFQRMLEIAGGFKDIGKRVREIPALHDLDERFRVMDAFDEYLQVISLAGPPPETLAEGEQAAELARIGNDGMAELCSRHPDRFAGFVAAVAMDDVAEACREAKRAVTELGAAGAQIYTNINGEAPDEPKFLPFFETMATLDRPIWVHPYRGANFPDFLKEDKSKYEIWWTFGWPYETSATMARLVFSGLFDRLPNIKIITHHLGGMVPYFEGRVGPGWDQLGARTSDEDLTQVLKRLKRRPLDYFRDFYADTAVFGAIPATECGLKFFGADKVLFASDSPFDPEKGPMFIRETIRVLDALDISEADRRKIYRDNAERLCGIKVE